MMKNLYFLTIILLAFGSCTTKSDSTNQFESDRTFKIKWDTLSFFDDSRNRKIPVAIYAPETAKKLESRELVLFNHSYGKNSPDSYLFYSYLTEHLASKGYFVVSIQHELPTDFLLQQGNHKWSGAPFGKEERITCCL